jgi:hypothetical protein
MIYLKYDLVTGAGLGLRKQSAKDAPPVSDEVGFLPIEEGLDPKDWSVDLGTLSLIPREADPEALNEQSMTELRMLRDAKLAACDWRVVADSPLSEAQRSEWVNYRQALRDLPSTIQGPLLSLEDVVWPSEPS